MSDCLRGQILSSPALEPGKLRWGEGEGGNSAQIRGEMRAQLQRSLGGRALTSFPENFVLMLWEIFVNSFSHVIF